MGNFPQATETFGDIDQFASGGGAAECELCPKKDEEIQALQKDNEQKQ